MEGLDFRCDLFHGAGFPMARSAPSRAFFWSVADIYVVTARVSGLIKGGLTPDGSNPLASSKQAGFGDRLSGFAANQATMCLAAYFGIFALAFVRPVVADPAVRV